MANAIESSGVAVDEVEPTTLAILFDFAHVRKCRVGKAAEAWRRWHGVCSALPTRLVGLSGDMKN